MQADICEFIASAASALQASTVHGNKDTQVTYLFVEKSQVRPYFIFTQDDFFRTATGVT